jgi:hypothetical protein
MPDADGGSKPGDLTPRLGRAALDRVLARAAELQNSTGDPAEEFSEAQLLELGQEVGIAPENLRQALAEERTRAILATSAGGSLGWFGSAVVTATRTVPGSQAAVLAGLNGWMQREESLRVKRQLGDRFTWEPRTDLIGRIRQAIGSPGRPFALTVASEVAATVLTVDEQQVIVTLEADLSARRKRLVGEAGIGLVAGGFATAACVAMGVAAAVAFAPVVAVPAIAGVAAHSWLKQHASRAQLALEQVLDHAERGELSRAPSLLDIAAAATASLPRRRP